MIDTAMMISRLKAIGTIRYDHQDYCADGHFIKEGVQAITGQNIYL
jgi:hypothetical protein